MTEGIRWWSPLRTTEVLLAQPMSIHEHLSLWPSSKQGAFLSFGTPQGLRSLLHYMASCQGHAYLHWRWFPSSIPEKIEDLNCQDDIQQTSTLSSLKEGSFQESMIGL